jgi:hypothetical protein
MDYKDNFFVNFVNMPTDHMRRLEAGRGRARSIWNCRCQAPANISV